MIRKLAMTKDADKFISQLDAKPFRQVVRKIFALADNPTPPDSLKLEGSNYYRADQGEYRIVYFFEPETLYIIIVGKRNDDDVYAQRKRK
jgi:mRNA interferase RelE/StbE